MIYEVRTYDLKPGSMAKFEAAFTDGLEVRNKYSKLAAFWRTEVGPLNQVIHVWPYNDLNERDEVRKASAKDTSGKWPPKTGEFTNTMNVEILAPAPFMRPLLGEPQELGKVYEMRIYTYQPGAMPKVLDGWGAAIAEREKFSPLAACWYSELGNLNRFFHVWPYKDMAEREKVRAEATKALAGKWPPQTGQSPVHMESKMLVPASFSPLR